MARLVGKKAFDSDEMVLGGGHNDFRGIIRQVRWAPFDYAGSQFQDPPKDYGFHMAANVQFEYVNDDGETVTFWEPLTAGNLAYMISSNGTEADDSRESDIDYPGSPIGPDLDDPGEPFGIDIDEVREAFRDIYNECKDRDEYRQRLIDEFGGLYPFGIGRDDSLRKGTKWQFFSDKAKLLMEPEGEWRDGGTTDSLFRNIDGHFVRLPPAQRGGNTSGDGEKITPKHILAMTVFHGRVDDADDTVDEAPKSKASSKAGKAKAGKSSGTSKGKAKAGKQQATTSQPPVQEDVESHLVECINELAADEIEENGVCVFEDVKTAFRPITINKNGSKFAEDDRLKAWKLITKSGEEFFNSQDNWDFDDGTLTVS